MFRIGCHISASGGYQAMGERIAALTAAALATARRRYAELAAALDAMSPLKVLGRGYAIAQDESGRVIREKSDVKSGDLIRIRLQKDRIDCVVK